ncbi:MAG: NADH-quinone oxidoreductase subunit N [Gemmatimonadales bacterium]|nr:MAG: NADH-quinone oxidoreductase subunit N [Gemmatimonadales bacterium]
MVIDLNNTAGLLLALAPELVLGFWCLVVMIWVAWRHGSFEDQWVAGVLSLAGLVMALGTVIWLWASDARAAQLAGMMALDPYRYATAVLFLLGAILTVLLSLDYLKREGVRIPEYYLLLLFGTLGMMFMGGGSDLIVIFLGLELMSVAVYVLAGIDRRSPFCAEAALKYFLLGAFASGFFLYGIALIYGATGTTNLVLIGTQVSGFALSSNLMALLGLGLLLIGFAFKVAAVPFHMWTPDVYDGSPTPVTGYMAAAVKAAGFAALLRVLFHSFGGVVVWHEALWWLAVITMVAGNLVALAQRQLKRMLAYSSIAHAGYLLAAVTSGSSAGAAAFLFYALAYTLMTIGAFAVLAAAGRGGERGVSVDDLNGLGSRRPWLAAAMTVFMLSLLGFPGTAGFIGKWYILSAAIDANQQLLAVVLVLTSVISAGYYLPPVMAMYMRASSSPEAHSETTVAGGARLVVALSAALLVVFGFWPNAALEAARRGSTGLTPAVVYTVEGP